YLPDAVFNYLSLLGWSIDGDRTIFSREEAIEEFDLVDVSRNPAIFDPDKLAWMNGEYIRALDQGAFRTMARPHVDAAVGRSLDDGEWARFDEVADLVQERTRLLPEAGEQVVFLFEDFAEYNRAAWDKVMTKDGVPGILKTALARLASVDTWNAAEIESALRAMLEEMGLGAAKGLQPLRVAVTGSSVSPPLFESMAALGREKTLERLERAQEALTG
ncbi:MAG: glutamate--tRNA ligase family protein, partial [Acidimicrobiia bacterium]